MQRAVRLTFFAPWQGGYDGNGTPARRCSTRSSLDQPLKQRLAALVTLDQSAGPRAGNAPHHSPPCSFVCRGLSARKPLLCCPAFSTTTTPTNTRILPHVTRSFSARHWTWFPLSKVVCSTMSCGHSARMLDAIHQHSQFQIYTLFLSRNQSY